MSAARAAGPGRVTAPVLALAAAALGACSAPPPAAVAVGSARVVVPLAAGTPAPVYLTIDNPTGGNDTLLDAATPAAASVVLNDSLSGGSPETAGIDVPAHAAIALGPFGSDLLLIGPHLPPPGGTITLTLGFRHAGRITVRATVTAVAASATAPAPG